MLSIIQLCPRTANPTSLSLTVFFLQVHLFRRFTLSPSITPSFFSFQLKTYFFTNPSHRVYAYRLFNSPGLTPRTRNSYRFFSEHISFCFIFKYFYLFILGSPWWIKLASISLRAHVKNRFVSYRSRKLFLDDQKKFFSLPAGVW